MKRDQFLNTCGLSEVYDIFLTTLYIFFSIKPEKIVGPTGSNQCKVQWITEYYSPVALWCKSRKNILKDFRRHTLPPALGKLRAPSSAGTHQMCNETVCCLHASLIVFKHGLYAFIFIPHSASVLQCIASFGAWPLILTDVHIFLAKAKEMFWIRFLNSRSKEIITQISFNFM